MSGEKGWMIQPAPGIHVACPEPWSCQPSQATWIMTLRDFSVTEILPDYFPGGLAHFEGRNFPEGFNPSLPAQGRSQVSSASIP